MKPEVLPKPEQKLFKELKIKLEEYKKRMRDQKKTDVVRRDAEIKHWILDKVLTAQSETFSNINLYQSYKRLFDTTATESAFNKAFMVIAAYCADCKGIVRGGQKQPTSGFDINKVPGF